MRLTVYSLVAFAACGPSAAATLHVCPDGSGEYPNLHAAVAAAVSGDVIELCDGVFSGEENVDVDVGAKSLTFRSLHGSEATTIDVEIIGGEFDEPLPYMGFLLGSGSTVLEGLTILNAVGDSYAGSDGAAIRCLGGSLVMRDVWVRDPYGQIATRGAGVFIQGGSLDVTDCGFVRCRADDEGGAIYAEGTWVSIQGSTFIGNGSCGSSAVWLDAGADISDSVFEHSGGAYCQSGPYGNVLEVRAGEVAVRRCRFSDNVDISGGCAIVWPAATVLLEDCLVEGAIGESGGAVVSGGTLTLRRCVLRNNTSSWTGGALSARGSVTLEGCVFHDNFCYQPATHGGAGAATIRDLATLVVRDCTFFRNGVNGGSSITLGNGSRLTVENSIFAFGGRTGSGIGPVHCNGAVAELSVGCTDIFGNAGGDWIGCLAGREGQEGNFAADPLFCDVEAGEFGLRADSPCAPEQAGECGGIGALGVACGSTGVEAVTWGGIKSLFR